MIGYASTGSFVDSLSLIKTDYLGNLQWQVSYNNMSTGQCIRQTNDGSIIISCNFNSSPSLVKLEPDPVLNSSFISVSSDSLIFGQISLGDSSSSEITIINSGFNLLTISELIVEEPFTCQIISGSDPLEFGDSTLVSISFSPQAAGLFTSSLSIVSDADNIDTLEVYLEGEGVITGVFGSAYNENLSKFNYLDISPNPFNASTTISFNLSASSDIKLAVYDITGREVASLVTGHSSLGQHSVVWDASGQSSGVYFVRLTVDGRW